MDENKTLVYLDNLQAGRFLLFQKYFIPFNVMVDARVFEQKAATIALRFDKDGVLKNIIRTDLLYSDIQGFEFING